MASDPDPAFQEMRRRLDRPAGPLDYVLGGLIIAGLLASLVLGIVQLAGWFGWPV